MPLTFAPADSESRPLVLLTPEGLKTWLADQPPAVRSWTDANAFTAKAGACLVVPDADGVPCMALVGLGDPKTAARRRFTLATARGQLPEGAWRIENADALSAELLEESALGWLLSGYRFGRYAEAPAPKATLVSPSNLDATKIEAIAAAEALSRDLINTPANDMGPDALEQAVRDVAGRFDATLEVTTGEALLAANFPLIHTVGRAATRLPRLLDMTWGTTGPRLTLVGKGVCFDTGGLNLKPGASMALMKKDMGGAATVLGLAQAIMALNLPLRLRVLIPAVENAVAGDAFRPGDILTSRKGLTVEINNTDAEGRLVLADALAFAAEGQSDLTISMATLTGAARVAVGPDLAPFYCDDDKIASALGASGARVRDPLWRMPFWDPYETMIEPGIADLDNAPSGGFAGSITAALFLRRFTAPGTPYVHFDIYGWQPTAAPGRPKGGTPQGARAILDALPDMLNL